VHSLKRGRPTFTTLSDVMCGKSPTPVRSAFRRIAALSEHDCSEETHDGPTWPTSVPTNPDRLSFHRPRTSRSQSAILTATCCVGAVVASAGYYLKDRNRQGDWMFDLEVFVRAARSIKTSTSMYYEHSDMRYTHPPFNALFYRPLIRLDPAKRAIIWNALTLLSLNTISRVTWKAVLPHSRFIGLLPPITSLAALLLDPVRKELLLGQTNTLACALILLDNCSWIHMTRAHGFLTGVATSIKLTPGVFAPYYFFRGDYRAFRNMLSAFGASVAIGFAACPRESLDYWTHIVLKESRAGAPQDPRNQSPYGILFRLLTPQQSRTIWRLAGLPALLIATFGIASQSVDSSTAAPSMLGLLSCLLSPISWNHHYIWCIPAGIICVSGHISRSHWPALSITCSTLFAFLAHPYTWNISTDPQGALHLSAWQQVKAGIYPVAGLALIVLLKSATLPRKGEAA